MRSSHPPQKAPTPNDSEQLTTPQHGIDDVIADSWLYRLAEAYEMPIKAVRAALARVQAAFVDDAEKLVETNTLLTWGDGYVVLDGGKAEYTTAIEAIKCDAGEIDADALVTIVLWLHSTLFPHVGETYALPIALPPERVDAVVHLQWRLRGTAATYL